MNDVIPGIFEKEWSEIERKINLVAPATLWIQIDVSDKTFVPEESFIGFEKLKETYPNWPGLLENLSFEAHLLTVSPEKYIPPLAAAGFKRIIAHVESQDPRRFLEEARFESIEVGLALDASGDIELLEPYLDEVDFVQIMTTEAGTHGEKFMPETVEKIRTLRQNLPDLAISVEGGITDQSSKIVTSAGATRIVATDYIFQDPQRAAEAIERLKKV